MCSNALKAVSVVTTVCPVGPLSACLSACLSAWLRWFDGLLWLVCVRALTLAPIQLIAKHLSGSDANKCIGNGGTQKST